jgi:hypothetical protein
MRNNELIFCKHRCGRYTAHLCNKDRSNGYWCYGSGIGNNRLFAFINLWKDLYRFNHIKEILFVRKIINVYGKI